MSEFHDGNVLNERRFGALEASLTYLTQRVEELGKRLDKLDQMHSALERLYDLHMQELVTRDPYMRLLHLEQSVQEIRAASRDNATKGNFLKSQWTWLIAGISAGGTTIQLLQRFL